MVSLSIPISSDIQTLPNRPNKSGVTTGFFERLYWILGMTLIELHYRLFLGRLQFIQFEASGVKILRDRYEKILGKSAVL